MGYSIQASGELVYTMGVEAVRIPASSLEQGEHVQNESTRTKDDDESWLVSFKVGSQTNQFIWHVNYSVGPSGASIDHCELVQCPKGVALSREPTFKVVESGV